VESLPFAQRATQCLKLKSNFYQERKPFAQSAPKTQETPQTRKQEETSNFLTNICYVSTMLNKFKDLTHQLKSDSKRMAHPLSAELSFFALPSQDSRLHRSACWRFERAIEIGRF
jgi:hypothetical protein